MARETIGKETLVFLPIYREKRNVLLRGRMSGKKLGRKSTGRCFTVVDLMLDGSPELITVDK
jgi:hypothetical protein